MEPYSRNSSSESPAESERQRILAEFSGGPVSYPGDRCVHDLFDEQADRHPSAVAVSCLDYLMTYAELRDRADSLARHLSSLGVQPGALVGIFTERSIEMIVGLLAILKAGGAYVPLDPAYPRERLAFMIADARISVVLTQGHLISSLPFIDGRVVSLDRGPGDAPEYSRTPSGSVYATTDDVAYVTYTSGSAGRPKGVYIPHRGVVRLVRSPDYADFSPEHKFLQLAPLAFDASTFEIWGALANGAHLVIPRPGRTSLKMLTEMIRSEQVTTLFLTTALFNQIAGDSHIDKLTSLRQLVFGGEVVSGAHVRQAALALPGCRMIHAYGPTENTTFTTCYTIVNAKAIGVSVPIGKPISNTRVYLLNSDLTITLIGEPGELYIGGEGLAAGYLNRPDLDREKFIQNPFGEPGDRLYRSGDLARWLADGNLEFLGRIDRQVKIRGFRVEPSEVESHLSDHPGLQGTAVVASADPVGGKRLVAYVVPAVNDYAPSGAELRAYLSERLPEYMIPSLFVPIDHLPLTANNKIDYQSLETEGTPTAGSSSPASSALSMDVIENQVAEAWSEVLGVGLVRRGDRFLDLGGHSLAAIKVISTLSRLHGVEAPLRILLENSSVAQVAQAVIDLTLHPAAPLDRIMPTSSDNETFLASYAQTQFWMLQELGARNALPMRIRVDGPLDVAALSWCFDQLVERHKSLRTTFAYVDGALHQVVQPARPGMLRVIDVSGYEHSIRDVEAERVIAKMCTREFDLETMPAWRAGLLVLEPEKHLLILTIHHIICDRWSIAQVLFPELEALYSASRGGDVSPLPPLPIEYTDFASWEKRWITGPVARNRLEYWRKQLSACPAGLDLPLARPRPANPRFRSALVPVTIRAEVTAGLRELAQREGCTLFIVLLAAYQTVLHRYSGRTDIIVGTPVANRTRPETHGLFGCLLNEVAIRTDLSGNPTFRELLARTRAATLAALDNELPFIRVVEAVNVDRSAVHAPIFQVMFAFDTDTDTALRLDDLQLTVEADEAIGELDLLFQLTEDKSGMLFGFVEYDVDLFDKATAQRTANHLETILSAVADSSEDSIGRLPLLPQAELDIIRQWSQPRHEKEVPPSIQAQFARQVSETPDAPALTSEDRTLSYADLGRRTDALARRLQQAGACPGVVCGLYADRSLDMVVGMLAILTAGSAYVPLDPSYPAARVALVLKDSGAPIVLVSPAMSGKAPLTNSEIAYISTQDPGVSNAGGPRRLPPTDGEDPAYLIYTSGSTGSPKGVVIPHRALSNFLAAMDQRLGPDTAKGVWLSVTSISFDISVLELLWPLVRGGHVVIAGDPRNLQRSTARPDVGRRTKAMDFSLFYFAADDDGDPREKYRLLIDGARFADASGFSAVWTPERHFHQFGGLYPNPSVTSAALAMVTRRVRIRAGSVVLPLHHPVRVAEEWSVVDNLSQGRVEVSFASGWQANDFVLKPENFAARRELMYDGIAAIQKLWAGDSLELPDSSGLPVNVRLHPRPVQRSLPVWITSAGTPETWERAGAIGAGVLTHLLGQTPEQLAAKIELYRHARARGGHAPEAGKVAVMLHTYIGADLAAVHAQVRAPFKHYLRSAGNLTASMAANAGVEPEEITDDDWDAIIEHHLDRYLRNDALIGTPSTCREMVDRLRTAGVTEVACLIDFGVPTDDALAGLRQLDLLHQATRAEGVPKNRRSLAELTSAYRPTAFQCTPTLAAAIARDPELLRGFDCVRTWLVGGETLPAALAADVRRALPATRLVNMYGPTETTIWSTCHDVTDEDSLVVPIGRPIRNTKVYVVDRWLQPVPIGVPGELLIAGQGVAAGYSGQPELTAERFIPDPTPGAGGLAYRTGDLARFRADGSLEFTGRGDTQVKIRGHRVELAEVEGVLLRHPAIRAVAVVAHAISPGELRSVAYFSTRAGARPAPADLREFLDETLPDYMIPEQFIVLDELPQTPHGKVDRGALPAPSTAQHKPREPAAPATSTQRVLLKIWREVLGTPHVSIDDDFFDLQGHSLLAMEVVGRVESALSVNITVRALFRHRTIRKLARHTDLLSLAPSHYPVSAMQKRFWDLHQRGADEILSYLINLNGRLDPQVLKAAFAELASRHKSLRARFIEVDGDLCQVVDPNPAKLDVQDLTGLAEADQQAVIDTCCRELSSFFSLATGPPVRAALLQLRPEEYFLAITVHGIVSDEWSVSRTLLPELGAFYQGIAASGESQLPAIPHDFVDCVAFGQRQRATHKNISYWTRHLAGYGMPLTLTTIHHPAKLPAYSAARTGFALSLELSHALRTITMHDEATMFSLLLAAFGVTLRGHTGREDIVVGTPVANRGAIVVDGGLSVDTEKLVGRFTSYLPLRIDLTGDPTFDSLLRRVQEIMSDAAAHDDLPCFAVEDTIRGEHSLDGQPLFRIVFQMECLPACALDSVSATIARGPRTFSQFDFHLEVCDTGSTITVDLTYRADIFDASTAAQLADDYRAVLQRLSANLTCAVSEVCTNL